MILIAIATLSPAVLIFIAIGMGGIWAWLALGFMTIFAFSLDRLTPEEINNADPEAEFPGSPGLLALLALLHLCILFAAIGAIGGDSGLTVTERGAIGVAAALFMGQISHPVAHELIHKAARPLRFLGQTVYTSMLFGHHASAHLRVHHVNVGSPDDPNSARLGEGFYSFAFRAWGASFRAGMKAENKLRKGRSLWQNPYIFYVAGAVAAALLAFGIAGLAGLSVLIVLSVYAQLQILMSDYVQHYGLQRHRLADGRLEPVGPQHSWNAPHWFTSAMSLNAPRHSDHHVRPARPYPALQLDEDKMPCLPFSLPVMAGIALVPPVWRRIMNPRCAKWLPVWIDRPAKAARDISPEVLSHAKSGGASTGVLTDLPHAKSGQNPGVDRGRNNARPRRRADDGS